MLVIKAKYLSTLTIGVSEVLNLCVIKWVLIFLCLVLILLFRKTNLIAEFTTVVRDKDERLLETCALLQLNSMAPEIGILTDAMIKIQLMIKNSRTNYICGSLQNALRRLTQNKDFIQGIIFVLSLAYWLKIDCFLEKI